MSFNSVKLKQRIISTASLQWSWIDGMKASEMLSFEIDIASCHQWEKPNRRMTHAASFFLTEKLFVLDVMKIQSVSSSPSITFLKSHFVLCGL